LVNMESDPGYNSYLMANAGLTLDDADRNVFTRYGNTFHYIKGQLLFAAGDNADYVYLIQRGRLNIYRLNDSGRQVTVAFRRVGEIVGMAEALYGGERICYAEAMEKVSVTAVTTKDFKEILYLNPLLAVRVAEVLGARLREAHSVIHEMASYQVPARIALILLKLSEKAGTPTSDGVSLNLKMTHEEIARMVGTSRQSVTTVLNSFKQEGSVAFKGREIDKIYPALLLKWLS